MSMQPTPPTQLPPPVQFNGTMSANEFMDALTSSASPGLPNPLTTYTILRTFAPRRPGAYEDFRRDFRPATQHRSKVVCGLDCKHCGTPLSNRAMKAILLADMNVELYSTDLPPQSVELVGDDYQTRDCHCRIRDCACVNCGSAVGYHIVAPCHTCLESANNGHFWMFYVNDVSGYERKVDNGKLLYWHTLPRDEPMPARNTLYEKCMR